MSDLLPVADTLDELSKLIRTAAATPAPAPAPAPSLTDAAMSLIKPFIEQKEGDQLTAYRDSGGTWTIGYGHTVGVTQGMTITQAQADAMFATDLMAFASGVLPLLTKIPTTGQFAAMISLAYNIGLGGFKTSSVRTAHNAGNFTTAAADFLLWDKEHENGALVVVPGLLSRRQAESAMYLKG